MASFFQRYLLPGFIFQSVIIAGDIQQAEKLLNFSLAQDRLAALLEY